MKYAEMHRLDNVDLILNKIVNPEKVIESQFCTSGTDG